MPLDDSSPPNAVSAGAARHEAAPLAEDGTSAAARMAEVARRDLVIRAGLDGVAAWEAATGALTEDEMDAARQRIANESAMLSAIADWGAAEDWADWADTAE